MILCNVETYEDSKHIHLCNKLAIWKHPRWPTGTYCEEHKQTLEQFFPRFWTKIESDVTDGTR